MLTTIFALVLVSGVPHATTSTKAYDATFVECYDADTCTFDVHLGMGVVMDDQRFRLCDIQAPEVRPLKTRKAGLAARDAISEKLRSARDIQLLIPQKKACWGSRCDKKGKYGRWLAYVYADGKSVNQWLLDERFAKPYTPCR